MQLHLRTSRSTTGHDKLQLHSFSRAQQATAAFTLKGTTSCSCIYSQEHNKLQLHLLSRAQQGTTSCSYIYSQGHNRAQQAAATFTLKSTTGHDKLQLHLLSRAQQDTTSFSCIHFQRHDKLQLHLPSRAQQGTTSCSCIHFQEHNRAQQAVASAVTFNSKKGTKARETHFKGHYKLHQSSQDEQQSNQSSLNNLNAHNNSTSIQPVFRETVTQVAKKSQPLIEPNPHYHIHKTPPVAFILSQ